MEGATGTSQQADKALGYACFTTSQYASASGGASSPDALRHEFESYLREPKIARTSLPFAGLVI